MLKDTPQLVQGFNVFLPPKFRIEEPLDYGSVILIHDQDSELDLESFLEDPMEDAKAFLNRIKVFNPEIIF